jgi:DNA-directed RNA polymerase specialized sigma24 family protein
MQPHGHDPMNCSAVRLERIAAIHRAHARELERRVARRAHATPQTIEDACSQAWVQLLTHPQVDVGLPAGRVLVWLALTATREVWRVQRQRRRDELVVPAALEQCPRARTAPSAEDVVAQRDRLRLVGEVAERPRRFLLRLATGHSYREIAVDEAVSRTTTTKQITRARRLLRELDAEHAA